MGGAIAGITVIAVLIITSQLSQRGAGRRAAERQLADDVEAWLRAREAAM